jgi:hypothetical protein
MLLDVLLALGLLLSSASQLRLAQLNIGPGEACLTIWLFLMLGREAGRLGPPPTPALSRLLIFWIVFALAMCIGTMTGFVVGDVHDPVWFRHDIIAYLITATASCLYVVEPGAARRLHRVVWLVATLGAAWLALQLAFGWQLVNIGDHDPWEWDRFRGLSDNTNQLALLCTVIGLLSLHLAETERGYGAKMASVICLIVAIIVGRLTQSDAFLLVLVTAGPLFISLKLLRWLMSANHELTWGSASAWIFVLSLPLVAAYVVPFGPSLAVQAEQGFREMTRGGTSGETEKTTRLRVHLWKEAIRRGLEAGALGLGPGPHLAIPTAILAGWRGTTVDPKHEELPRPSFTPNFEAHNTFLELFLQGGVLAAFTLVWLLASTLAMTLRVKLDALTTLICGIVIFSIFHVVVRHPIIWLALAICLVATANPRRNAIA